MCIQLFTTYIHILVPVRQKKLWHVYIHVYKIVPLFSDLSLFALFLDKKTWNSSLPNERFSTSMMALRCGGFVASTSELPALVEVPGATVAGFLGGVLPTPRKCLGVNSWDSESKRRYCGCVQCTSRSSVFLLLQSVQDFPYLRAIKKTYRHSQNIQQHQL